MKDEVKTIKSLWLIMLIFTFITTGHARVFWRWNSVAESDTTMESCGGKIAYSAPITLNNGNGQMTVYGFKEDISTVTETLRRTFNAPSLTMQNGSMATATINDNGMVINLIVISMQDFGPTTVFKLAQTVKEAARSKNPPQNPIKEIPAFPGAKTTFYARDDKTKSALAVASADTTAQAALDFYSTKLATENWTASLSSPNLPNPTGNMLFYQKKNQLCCVFVSNKENRQQINITVLYKTLSNGDL
jgi:uncharacterized protein YcgL (UPF0745 family)